MNQIPTFSPRLSSSISRRIACGTLLLGGALIFNGCGGGNSNNGGNDAGSALNFRAAATFDVKTTGGEVAEIAAAAPDGNSLLYTDSATGRIGRLDIANLSAITQTAFYDTGGEPTSVAITRDGKFAIAVVDKGNKAVVLNLPDLTEVRAFSLPGQPDSIAVSPDGKYAAIAIENQRDEEVNGGVMPQLPTGSLYVLNTTGAPTDWTGRNIALNLPSTLRFPTDAEPEYVSINAKNECVLTMQENNGVAIVSLASGAASYFSCGTTSHVADLKDDGAVSFTDNLIDARREPDGVAWTPQGNIVTANEGDYDVDVDEKTTFVGGRNFTVFSRSGSIVFDDKGELEKAVAAAGFYDDKRSDAKGAEPENVAVGQMKGRPYLFVALERANALVTYDFSNESSPRLLQVLPTGNRPEGVLTIPTRNLVISANEGDGTLSFFAP